MDTSSASLATTRRTRRALVLIAGSVLSAAVLTGACSSSPDTIHGTWHWPEWGVYESLDKEGNWGVWLSGNLEGDPYDWGTYTFDGEVLTYHNAEGSVCSGTTAVWTVEFAEGGDEAHQTFLEDSCSGSVRGLDRILYRHAP